MSKYNKVVRVSFPDESFIRAGTPVDKDIKPPQESTVRDTYFANLFREWLGAGAFDYNAEVHNGFRATMQEYIGKFVAMHMVTEDISKSVTATGLQMSIDTARIDAFAEHVLELKLFKDIVALLGVPEHCDDIVIREIDKVFGMAPIQAAEQRSQKQKEDEQSTWLHNTTAGIHNLLRDMSVGLRTQAQQSKLIPSPADPTLVHLMRQISESQRSSTSTTRQAQETQATNT